MKNFLHCWQGTSCLLLLLLAFVLGPIPFSFARAGTSFLKPVAWTITGKVVTPKGEALPGVTVLVKGTSNGTATGPDGTYTLSVPESPGTLVVSFIGYTTKEVAFTGPGNYNVTLGEDAKALEEVVVVGYGTQKKEDLTGSVIAVTAKDFNPGQISTPEQLIVGKVPGVQIISNGGAPGSGSQIRVRGGSSLNASNDPLVVIDGVPVDNTELKGTGNALNLINPNDIESFNILKDASATAIYGSRASNGVIIITTKKGRAEDKFKVNFSTFGSFYRIGNKVEVLSADEFRAAVNARGTAGQKALLGNANTDWQDEIFRRAFGTDNNLSFSGAQYNIPYRLSFGYLDQNGILLTSNLKRKSGSLSLTPSLLNDHLRVTLNVKGSMTNSRFADAGAIGAAIAFDPTKPVRVDEQTYRPFGGYYEWLEGNIPNINATRNPLSTLQQKQDKGEAKRSIGNIQLDYRFHFFSDLRANLNLGYDISRSEGSVYQPVSLATVYAQGGRRTWTEQRKDNNLVDFYLNYTKEVSALKSRIEALAGYSYQTFKRHEPSFPVLRDNLQGVSADTITKAAIFPFETEKRLKAFFGRVNYSFKNRYLVTANIRRDGTSIFRSGLKWGTFPSVALAWRIIEEPFLASSKGMTELKLRLGYGITGQQDISDNDYPFLARYGFSDNTAQYQFGDQYYLLLRPAGYDADIKWEETTAYNAGLDYGFAEGKISGTLDFYFKKTKDLISRVSPAAGTNLSNEILTNVGNIENKGVEAAINVNAVSTETFRWSFGVNATYNDNQITSLSKFNDPNSPGIARGGISGGTGNYVQIHTVGYAPYTFYVWRQIYDENGRPIEGAYEDLNRDGIINEKDLYRYKFPAAQYFLGFNSALTYGHWDLSFVLRANLGNYMYNNINSNNGTYRNISNATYLNNMVVDVLKTGFTNNRFFSDYYVENASFLRMDNINLAYNLGKVMQEKVNVRLSANAQNLFVITKYSGLDPETQFTESNTGGGIDRNYYPRPRTISVGVNLDF